MKTLDSVALATSLLVCASCAGAGFYSHDVDNKDWELYRKGIQPRDYVVFQPGPTYEQLWKGKRDPAWQETELHAGQWRAKRDCKVAGQAVRRGHTGWALYTSEGYDYAFLLPPLFDKVVPISRTVAYALPKGAETFVRCDLTTGEQQATPYTQVDGVLASENRFISRSTMPFFLSRPDPNARGLLEVTLIGIDLKPMAVIDRVSPWTRGTWKCHTGRPFPHVRYLPTKSTKTQGTFLLYRVTKEKRIMQRVCDARGFAVTPDLERIHTFVDNTNQPRLAVQVEQDLYYPMTARGVAVRPRPPGLVGLRPLRSGGSIQGWAALWETAGKRRWSIHRGYQPWLRQDIAPTEFFQDIVVMTQDLPDGHGGIAVQHETGRWDVMHQDEIEVANAPTAAIAIDLVTKRLAKEKRQAIRAENIVRKQRASARAAARDKAQADRRMANQQMVAAYQQAFAKNDFGKLYDIGCALGGDYFVDYVIASKTKNVSDLYNALDLASDSGRRSKIERRIRAVVSDYTPQRSGYGLYDQAMDNIERTYRENLQRWMDGGHPPVPNWTRR